MAAFTVWKFDGPNGAQQAAETLKQCQREGMVKIIDHAVVTWPEGDKKPTTHEGHEERWHGTGWGALWGVLILLSPSWDDIVFLVLLVVLLVVVMPFVIAALQRNL